MSPGSDGTRLRIFVLGANGQLAHALKEVPNKSKAVSWIYLPRTIFDVTKDDPRDLASKCQTVIINCAAYTDVKGADHNLREAYDVNYYGAARLADLCCAAGIRLIHLSTDFVFGGRHSEIPYTERDTPLPFNVYGCSKLAGEHAILMVAKRDPFFDHLIIRTAGLFGLPRLDSAGKIKRENFFVALASAMEADPAGSIEVVYDVTTNITAAWELARTLYWFARKAHTKGPGIYHVTNPGEATWYEIAKFAANQLGFPAENIQPVSQRQWLESRGHDPRLSASYTGLSLLKYQNMPSAPVLSSWQTAVAKWCSAWQELKNEVASQSRR